MPTIVYTTDVRERKVVQTVNENVSISYDVRNQTGQPVNLINGRISQAGERTGVLNVDVTSNTAYISLEKFASLDHTTRKAVLSAISDHIEAILTEVEEEQVTEE